MKTTKTLIISIALLGLVLTESVWADEPLPAVAGISGMSPVTDSSCFAVWIPVPENNALAGLMWYNNDGLTVFPEIRLESGSADYPVSLTDSHLVAEDVSGDSSAWSGVAFTESVRCASEGLYVLIRLPEGSEQEDIGFGGGAGIGFVADGGYEGWMSIDGEQWVRVGRNFGFAVQPQFVPAAGTMLQMKGAQQPENGVLENSTDFMTALLPASPNPFNPSTEIRFSLRESGQVTITIYDLKGRKIADLANEVFPQGENRVTWRGQDVSGRRVSSGVYFAHMQVGADRFTRRMLLVK